MQIPENYTEEKLTIDLVRANVITLAFFIPVILIYGLPYILIWKPAPDISAFIESASLKGSLFGISSVFMVLIAGIIVHELIHGLVFALYADRGFKSVKFGILWKYLAPYCHCSEALRVKHYRIAVLAPAVVLGLVPGILASILGSPGLLVFGIFFTVAAGGDFLVFNLIWKENRNDLVKDHPSEAGCFVYRENL